MKYGRKPSARTANGRANRNGFIARKVVSYNNTLFGYTVKKGRWVRRSITSKNAEIREIAEFIAVHKPSKWSMRTWPKDRTFRRAMRMLKSIARNSDPYTSEPTP